MLTIPPPAKMPMLLALAYARIGYYVRPITWDGITHDHGWLHYPAGAPLAYYWGDISVTALASTDVFTGVNHGLYDGCRVKFHQLESGVGLSTSLVYYVRDIVGDTFKVSLTRGGSAVDITNNYTTGTSLRMVDSPGRPWLAADLTRSEWLGYWTALPVSCFEEDVTNPPCLCSGAGGEWDWVLYDDDEEATGYEDVTNPNAIMGLQNCDGECDCASTGTDGSSGEGSGGGTTDGGGSGGSGGGGSGPTPSGGGAGGGSGGGGSGGSSGGGPTPSGGAGSSSGSSGSKRPPKPKKPKVGPTITMTAIQTDPVGLCVATQADRDHTWSLQIELSSEGVTPGYLYSCRITVLGEVLDQWILAPGDSQTVNYTRSLNPLSASFPAIGSGAAFGGGPACNTGKVVLEPLPICEENEAPVANNDSYNALANSGLSVLGNVIDNDTDAEEHILAVTPQTSVAGTDGGLFTLLANGSVSFDPNGEFDDVTGSDTRSTSINYFLYDPLGGNDTGTITVVVSGEPNDPPVAVDDSFAAYANASSAVLGNVITNDSDPNGDTISITPVSGGAGSTGGLFTILANGSFTFDPDGDFDDLDDGETRTTAVVYTLVDEHGATDTASVSVLVTGENDPLVAVGTIPDQSDSEGDSISFDVSSYFADPDDTVYYDATGLPGGLSIAVDSGLISGTINDGAESSSPYAVTITASALGETDANQSFSWAVADPAPTAVGTIPDQSSDEGESISFDVSSYFDDDDAFSFSATGLPTGLSINSSTGVITGTIANESAGSNAVTVTATDGDDDVDQLFDWTVTDPSPVAVGTIPDQSTEEGVGGISWDITGYFSDPDGDTLSYSSSTLPPGLSVSSGGTVSGTISGGASSGSPYAVTITASDGDHSVDQTFDWNVDPP